MNTAHQTRKLRWFQFSLRALLVVTLAFGCGLAWLAWHRQRFAIEHQAAISKNTNTASLFVVEELVLMHSHRHGAYRRNFLKPGWEIRWNHDRDVKTLNEFPRRFNRRTSGNVIVDEFSELDWQGDYRYIAAIRGNKVCAACHSVGKDEIIGVIAVNKSAGRRR